MDLHSYCKVGSAVDCGGDRIYHEDHEYALFPPHTPVKSKKRESSPSGLTPYILI